MANVFDLSAKLTLDRGDFESGLGDAESALGKFGSAAGSFLGTTAKVTTAAITAGATAVGTMATMATKSYADYEQLVGGIETLYGDAAGTMMQFAEQAYKTTGQSANEFMDAAISTSAAMISSVEGDQAKAAELTNMAMVDMADNANKLGTDMEAIQNAYKGFSKQNFTMLDNLALGYAGTKEGMEKLLADAQAISGVEYDVESYADIVEAIHVIQEDMGIAGTTAKEANETISGSLASMKSAWENLVTGLADPNADIGALIGNMVDSASTFLDNLVPVVANALNGIGGAIEALAPVLEEQLPSILDELLPTLLSSATTLIEGFVNLLPTLLSNVLPTLLESALTLIESVATTLAEALPTIIDTLGTAITKAMPKIIKSLSTIAPQLLTSVMDSIRLLAVYLPRIIGELSKALGEQLPTLIPIAVNGMLDVIDALVSNLGEAEEGIRALLEGLGEGIIAAIPIITEYLPEIIDTLVTFFELSAPTLIQAGTQLLISLVTAISDATPTILEALPTLIDAMVELLITLIPQIVEAGVQLLSALADNADVIISNIALQLPTIIGGVVDGIIELLPLILTCGVDLLGALFDSTDDILETLATSISTVIDGVIEKIGEFLQDFIDIGKDLFKGIGDGFEKAKDYVEDKGSTLIKGFKALITGDFGIHSPSTVFRDDVGYWLGAGIGVGIEESTDFVLDKAKKLGEDTFDTLGDYSDMDLGASVELDKNVSYNASSTLNALVTDTIREVIEAMEFTVPVYVGNKRIEELVVNAVNTSDFKNGGHY